MKKLGWLVASLFLFASCQDKNEVKVSLFDNSLDGSMAYLYMEEDSTHNFFAVDSVVIKEGKVAFKLPTPQDTAMAYIHLPVLQDENKQDLYFVHELGSIAIELKSDTTATVTAGQLNADYSAYKQSADGIRAQLKANKRGAEVADSLIAVQDQLTAEYLKPLMQSRLGEFVYLQVGGRLTGLSAKDLLEDARPEFRETLRILMQPLETQETLVGQKFIEIKGNSPEGKPMMLSSFVGKGKVVLIDFWASWCPPCRRDMPFIVYLYETYKDQGLEIVGVSLDSEKNLWTDYIQKANMTWVQLSELKKWKASAVSDYNVRSIPYTVLIDKEGTIRAEYLSGLDLEEEIQNLLSE